MATDLTKRVEDWHTQSVREYDSADGKTNRIREYSQLRYILRDLVDEIEANREEIGKIIGILEKSLPAIEEYMKVNTAQIKKLKTETQKGVKG